MCFRSYEEVFYFFRKYAKETWFTVCNRGSNNDLNGNMRYAIVTCAQEGKSRRSSNSPINVHPISKTNYKARITAAICSDEVWKITNVVLEPNDELSPYKSRFYRCNKVIPTPMRRRLELNDQASIRLSKSFNSFVDELVDMRICSFKRKIVEITSIRSEICGLEREILSQF